MYLHFAQPVRQARRRDDPNVIQGEQGEVADDDEEVDAEGELVDQRPRLVAAVLLVPHQTQDEGVARGQDGEEQARCDQPERGGLGDAVVGIGVIEGASSHVICGAVYIHCKYVNTELRDSFDEIGQKVGSIPTAEMGSRALSTKLVWQPSCVAVP